MIAAAPSVDLLRQSLALILPADPAALTCPQQKRWTARLLRTVARDVAQLADQLDPQISEVPGAVEDTTSTTAPGA